MSKVNNFHRKNERGGAGVKFLLIALVLFLVGHAAYNYIPVAYQGQSFKQDMETAVVQSSAMPPAGAGSPVDLLKAKLTRMAQQQSLPPAIIDVKQNNNVMTAHVQYAQTVNILPFGIYNYDYVFDHTATPTGFLLKQ